MTVRIYNTLSRKKEPLTTVQEGQVRMYVCGPTVYDKAHVGHAMSALVFDIIRRYLEYHGLEVKHVMNFTDVDDKIIMRANALKIDPLELAEGYIREFDQHLQDLNILPPTVKPRATEEIQHIISFVQELIENGFAYEVEGDVYFRVRKLKNYGKLSGRYLEDMQVGARISVDKRKEYPMDFALWKKAKTGEPSWKSPWGQGRPGWHIECSAMSMQHLGDQIDIHGGGNDLVFPHHENEIAQSEARTGKPFARFWVHNGMLQLSGEKMSKSIGNLVTIEEFLIEHSGDALRIMVLNSGYRNPLTFNDNVIEQAEKALERLKSGFKPALPGAEGIDEKQLEELKNQIRSTLKGFEKTMDDDFNSAGALGHVFDLVRSINQTRADGATDEQLKKSQELLHKLTTIFGLKLEVEKEFHPATIFEDDFIRISHDLRKEELYSSSDEFRESIDFFSTQVNNIGGDTDMNDLGDSLINIRNIARKNRSYGTADYIRDRLDDFGVGLEDSGGGTIKYWK